MALISIEPVDYDELKRLYEAAKAADDETFNFVATQEMSTAYVGYMLEFMETEWLKKTKQH